jgi:hypothetical protein
MSGFSIEMLLKLVDQATGPVRGVIDQVRGLETATKQATAAAEPRPGGGFAAQEGAVRRAREQTEGLRRSIEGIVEMQGRLALVGMGFQNLADIGRQVSAPLDRMVDAAVRFEQAIESLARGAGILDQREDLGRSALALPAQTNVRWQEIVAGRRAFAANVGGERLPELAPIEPELLKLAYASDTSPEHLYRLLSTYMDVGKLSPEQGLSALQRNYEQGQRGAYEMRDMVRGMPGLTAQGVGFGLTGEQAAVDMPAFLQILRKTTGSASEADTRLRNVMAKLSDPKVRELVESELGINVGGTMAQARTEGRNPLFAVLDKIAEKLAEIDPSQRGALGSTEAEGVRDGAETLASTFRNFYVRAGVEAYLQLRDQLAGMTPTEEEARQTVEQHFGSRASTTAARLERRAMAAEKAQIQMGSTQTGTRGAVADVAAGAVTAAGEAAAAAPMLTNFGMTAWNIAGQAAEAVGTIGNAVVTGAIGYLGYKAAAARYPILSRIGAGAAGVIKAPYAAATGLAQGVAEGVSSTPGGAQALRTIAQGAARGAALGAATVAVEYGIDKGFEAATGRTEQVPGTIESLQRVWGHLTGLFAGEARQNNRQGTFSTDGRVNAAPFEGAKQAAAEAGAEMQSSLNVTATPVVETASLDAALEKARALNEELGRAGSLASQAQQTVSRAAAGARSTGALHDGYETR